MFSGWVCENNEVLIKLKQMGNSNSINVMSELFYFIQNHVKPTTKMKLLKIFVKLKD